MTEAEIKDRPRLCWILGVEIGEKFTMKGLTNTYYIDDSGFLKIDVDGKTWGVAGIDQVMVAINHPEYIIRIPKWTQQEIEDAKTIQRMFGKDNFTHVKKDEDGWPRLMDGDGKDPNVGRCSICMEKDMFPSLKPGQTVSLREIVGGDA